MNGLTLAVDVGNSRYKVGLFLDPASERALPEHVESLAIPLADDVPWETICTWLGEAGPPRGIVAGANPAGIRRVLESWPAEPWPQPVVVDDPSTLPLVIDLPFPGGVGIDRLLNAVAANVLRGSDRGAIIVDSGTATTVDAIDPTGAFRGGAILPGLELAARSLHQYTALLPLIPVSELAATSVPPVGRDTRSALRSGLLHGQIGAVRELVSRLRDEQPESALLLTGGGATLLRSLVDDDEQARLEPHLTLQGLVLSRSIWGGGGGGAGGRGTTDE